MASQALAPQIEKNETKKTFAMDEPVVIKDQLILSPGVWNGTEFTEENIQSALQNTDFSETGVLNLYLDHQDTENPTPKAVGNWAGFIKNLRYEQGRGLLGDLEIWHPMAEQWTKAKPKFGISATLAGPGDNPEDISAFKIESGSIVHDPACKPALLNLSKDPLKEMRDVSAFETVREKMGMNVEEFYAVPKNPPSKSKLPVFDAEHVRNAMARFNQTQFESEEEAKKAKEIIMNKAEKFGIKVDEFKEIGPELSKHKSKEDEEEKKKKDKKMQEESEENSQEKGEEKVENKEESSGEESTQENSESEDNSPSENDKKDLKGGENEEMTEEQTKQSQPSEQSSEKVEQLESKVDKLADSVQKLAEIQKETLNSQEESKEEGDKSKESESQDSGEKTQENSDNQKDKELQELKKKVEQLENKSEDDEGPKSKTLSASQESNQQNTNKLKNFSASKQMTNYLAKRIGA